jgi:hypothetical protein
MMNVVSFYQPLLRVKKKASLFFFGRSPATAIDNTKLQLLHGCSRK